MTTNLNDEMRDYLRANANSTVLLFDFVLRFMARFQLDPVEAGKLIAQWIAETC